jgi:hypothetical protein
MAASHCFAYYDFDSCQPFLEKGWRLVEYSAENTADSETDKLME